MDTCANCSASFQERPDGKGYKRYSLENRLSVSGKSAREELSRLTGSTFTPISKKRKGQFLCPSCWSNLSETTKFQKSLSEFFDATQSTSYVASKRGQDTDSPNVSFKRPRFTSTPLKKKSKVSRPIFAKTAEKVSKWDTIITAVRARQYKRALKGMYNATAASKRSFAIVAAGIIRKEVNDLMQKQDPSPLCRDVTIPSIAKFSWNDVMDDTSECAPLLFHALRGAVTSRANETSLMRGARVNLKPRLGTILALLLHTRSPRKASFLPTLLSIQFWRGRLKRETISQLSRMGICTGYEATLTAIDKIRSTFDSAALKLKADMEDMLKSAIPVQPVLPEQEPDLSIDLSLTVPNIDEEVTQYSDMEETVLYSDNEGDPLTDSIFLSSDKSMHILSGDQEEKVDDDDEEDEGDGDIGDDDDDEVEEEEDEEGDDDGREGAVDVEETEEMEEEGGEYVERGDERRETDLEENMEVTEVDQHPPGFTMCWDNVGKKVVTRRPTETVKNKYINMALGYAAVNRVSSVHVIDDNVVNAEDLPTRDFLPNENDTAQLKDRMSIVAGRIITRHLNWFSANFSDCAIQHIVHEKSLESIRKSILLNLGVFNEDPCSTQGAIGIYERLQKYVPAVQDKPYPVIVYGDGLSCERGNDAHRARANGLSPIERLEGIQPAIQEFHKEMLLLQDFYDDFFKGSSVADRGTLSQIRNLFNYRQVKSDISDNFTHAWELMCLVVEAYLCLLVMNKIGMQENQGRPSSAPEDIENATADEKNRYFEQLCKEVVDQIWQNLHTDRLMEEKEGDLPVLCCGEELDEGLIGCACKSSCPFGEYFHFTCASVDSENPPDPFYCCEECRNRTVEPFAYCHCKEDLGMDEPMIGCSAESNCTKSEWYHMRCVGIDSKKAPKGNWYCCNACKSKKGKRVKKQAKEKDPKEDFVLNYSKGILWRGLNLICRRDAVREADGPAMISFWKFDLVHFFGNKHPKYLILAHRLLASVNGWLPERLRFDLIHNRTVNYGGGIGRNLPLDFMNEVLNRLFKDLLDAAKGRYTDKTVQRCSQIVGPFGEALDCVFDSNVVENEVYRHRRRAQNRDGNVSRLIEFLQLEDLFVEQVGRNHKGFPGFKLSINPKQAGKFPAKMKQLSKRLDRMKQVVLNRR